MGDPSLPAMDLLDSKASRPSRTPRPGEPRGPRLEEIHGCQATTLPWESPQAHSVRKVIPHRLTFLKNPGLGAGLEGPEALKSRTSMAGRLGWPTGQFGQETYIYIYIYISYILIFLRDLQGGGLAWRARVEKIHGWQAGRLAWESPRAHLAPPWSSLRKMRMYVMIQVARVPRLIQHCRVQSARGSTAEINAGCPAESCVQFVKFRSQTDAEG